MLELHTLVSKARATWLHCDTPRASHCRGKGNVQDSKEASASATSTRALLSTSEPPRSCSRIKLAYSATFVTELATRKTQRKVLP